MTDAVKAAVASGTANSGMQPMRENPRAADADVGKSLEELEVLSSETT